MIAPERATTIPCPDCQAPLPVHSGYATWCGECGWNLKPATKETVEDGGILARVYGSIGRERSEALYRTIAADTSLAPRLSIAALGALAFASLIHAATLALAAGGLALIIIPWPHLVAIGGLLLLGFAWSLRPRIEPLPDNSLPREGFPALYALADGVADGLGATRVASIIIGDDFNAALSHAGWRNRPVLHLGLPLWAILDERERLALIGHELAHAAHGDVRRGFLIGAALDVLITWYVTLTPPPEPWPDEFAAGAIITVPLMKSLRLIPHGGFFALSHLLWRDSQRAEYLADRLAARLAGSAAMLGLLDKLQLRTTFELTLQRVAYGLDNEELFDALRRRIGEVPARELERIRRVQRLTGARLDATHPPTAFRIDMLQGGPRERSAGFEALALVHDASRELATLEAGVAREMIADFTRAK